MPPQRRNTAELPTEADRARARNCPAPSFLSYAPPFFCLLPPLPMHPAPSPATCLPLSPHACAHHGLAPLTIQGLQGYLAHKKHLPPGTDLAPLPTEAEGARARDWRSESASVHIISALGSERRVNNLESFKNLNVKAKAGESASVPRFSALGVKARASERERVTEGENCCLLSRLRANTASRTQGSGNRC